MSATREVLHDDNPGDVHAWQSVATLAAALGIAERTVRARLAAGTVERCTGAAGRSYYRVPATSSATSAADGNDSATGSRQLAAAELFALIREHGSRNERLALELGQARAAVGHLEHVRQVEQAAQAAHVAHLEHELGSVRQLARAIGDHAHREQARATVAEEQLAQARAQVEHERTRAAHLERLAQAPWYAVRERKRLRRELASG